LKKQKKEQSENDKKPDHPSSPSTDIVIPNGEMTPENET